MAIDTGAERSRRALLAGGIGGLVAVVAAALGRPLPASATDGDILHVGDELTATSVTKLTNLTNHARVLEATSSHGIAVYATSDSAQAISGSSVSNAGVRGSSATGAGVFGGSMSGHGVAGSSQSGRGVYGLSDTGAGLVGWSVSATGVLGTVGTSMPPTPPASTAVYGDAPGGTSVRGVHGRTTGGRGVFGQATTGQGIRGYATSGTAIYAASADPMAGYAIRALGRVKLDNCAGVATIGSGTKAKTVTPGIDLTSASAVVATLQGDAGGSTTVKRVAVNTTANTFTIHLTANATADVKVAWHLLG